MAKVITREMLVGASLERVHRALTDARHIGSWNAAATEPRGNVITLTYPGGQSFRWLVETPSPQVITWKCLAGPAEAAGKTASFTLTPAQDGSTSIVLEHGQWSSSTTYRKCEEHWERLLNELRRHAETTPGRERP